jgi:sugar lactone lactonase YvrE
MQKGIISVLPCATEAPWFNWQREKFQLFRNHYCTSSSFYTGKQAIQYRVNCHCTCFLSFLHPGSSYQLLLIKIKPHSMKYALITKTFIQAATMMAIAVACTKPAVNNPLPGTGGTPETPPDSMQAIVTTIAGKPGNKGNAEDGNGAAARFWNPTKMVYDNRNNTLYVADGTVIRSIDQQNNVKTYMPLGAISNFSEILDIDIAPGAAGGSLYFTTKENDLVRIEPAGDSYIKTKLADRIYAGNETGPLNSADHFDLANGVATGKNGEIYFFNTSWNTLHRIEGNTVYSFAGKATTTRGGNAWPFQDGQGESGAFGGRVPDIAADGNGNIYVADYNNDLVRMVSSDGVISSLFQYKNGFGIDKDGPVSVAEANRVTMVTASLDGTAVYFTTYGKGGNGLPVLRKVRPGKEVITVAGGETYGDGSGAGAGFGTIGGLAVSADGKTIYVAEPGKKVIRKVVIQ